MDYQDLADLTGLSVGTLRNIGCGSNSTRDGRTRIESALGVEIWPPSASPTPGAAPILQESASSLHP